MGADKGDGIHFNLIELEKILFVQSTNREREIWETTKFIDSFMYYRVDLSTGKKWQYGIKPNAGLIDLVFYLKMIIEIERRI